MALDLELIRRLLNRRLTDRTSSHYADCDGDHIDCAAVALLDEVERLKAALELMRAVAQKQSAEVERLRNENERLAGEVEQHRAEARRWAVRR